FALLDPQQHALGVDIAGLERDDLRDAQPGAPGLRGCNPIPLFRARVSLREDFILKVWAIWRYLLIAWGHWAAAPRPRVGEGAALASGCGHAAAGAVSAAAAAMRRRSVSAQDRLSAS